MLLPRRIDERRTELATGDAPRASLLFARAATRRDDIARDRPSTSPRRYAEAQRIGERLLNDDCPRSGEGHADGIPASSSGPGDGLDTINP